MKRVIISTLFAALASVSPAASLFWSANGTVQGGAGTWDTTTAHWGPVAAGPYPTIWNNANIDSAIFGGTVGTVTAGNVTVEQIRLDAAMTLSGGTITFSGPNAGIFANYSTGTGSLGANYTGSILIKSGAGRLDLNSSLNTIGKYKVTGGFVTIAAINRLGTAPATLVQDYFTLDGGGFGHSVALGVDLGATRGITIGAGGAYFGASAAANATTISAPIVGTSGGGLFVTTGGPFYSPYAAGCVLILANTANSWNGATTVQAGTLRLGVAGVVPDTSAVAVSGGTFDMNGFSETVGAVTVSGGGTISGTGTLTGSSYALQNGTISSILGGTGAATKTTSSTVTLSGANTFSGGLTLSAGKLRVGNNAAVGTGKLTLAAGTVSGNNATTSRTISTAVDLTGNVTLGNATDSNPLTFSTGAWTLKNADRTLTIDTITNTINSVIGEDASPRKLTKAGTGMLVLSGANTFSGGVNHTTATTLRVGNGSALGTGLLTIGGGATLSANNNTGRTLANAVTVTGDFNLGEAATGTGGLTINGNVDLGGTRTITTEGSTHAFGGQVSNGGIIKNGSGALTLSGNNTFANGVTVNAGRVNFNNANAAGTGAIALAAGSTIGSTASSPTIANNISLGAGTITAIVNSGVTLTLSGALSGGNSAGNISLDKTNAGTLNITRDNAFTGNTVVNAGKLSVNNTTGSATGNGTVTVNTNGTLGGNGFITGPVVVQAGGTVAAGNSVGNLHLADMTVNGPATNAVEMNLANGTAGTDWDLITGSGSLTFNLSAANPMTILLSGNPADFDPSISQFWTIFQFSGGVNGLDPSFFTVDSSGFIPSLSGGNFALDLVGNQFVNLTFTSAVPEPSTIALGALGGIALAVRTIRRRK